MSDSQAAAAGAGGGAGGAAGLLDEPAAGGGAGAGDQGGQGDQAAAAAAAAGQGEAPPAWAVDLSAEAPAGDGQVANRDYVTAKGFRDPDALVSSYRELEKQLHGGKGFVKIPGEGAKPEEIAAYRTAMGVPDEPSGYQVKLPELGDGENKLELDTEFVKPLAAAAHEAGVSAAAFGKLGDAFVQYQLDGMAAELRKNDADREALFKEWGGEKDAKSQAFRNGAKLLGLDRNSVAAMERALGTRAVMEKLSSLGALAGEDVLHGAAGDGGRSFGVGSLQEAEGAVATMLGDKDIQDRLNAKDPATVARYNRLNDAIAHYRALAAKQP